MRNLDRKTVKSFGDEVQFDQSGLRDEESYKIFKSYFVISSKKISKISEGFDMGCGSGR